MKKTCLLLTLILSFAFASTSIAEAGCEKLNTGVFKVSGIAIKVWGNDYGQFGAKIIKKGKNPQGWPGIFMLLRGYIGSKDRTVFIPYPGRDSSYHPILGGGGGGRAYLTIMDEFNQPTIIHIFPYCGP